MFTQPCARKLPNENDLNKKDQQEISRKKNSLLVLFQINLLL